MIKAMRDISNLNSIYLVSESFHLLKSVPGIHYPIDVTKFSHLFSEPNFMNLNTSPDIYSLFYTSTRQIH